MVAKGCGQPRPKSNSEIRKAESRKRIQFRVSNFCFLLFQFLLWFLFVAKRLDERRQFFQMRLENGRDGALRRPPARAFLSPAGRVVKIPLAENWEAPAGTSRRNVPTYS
jgi:hypothetical protein